MTAFGHEASVINRIVAEVVASPRRDFDSCQGKNIIVESGQKLFIISSIFAYIFSSIQLLPAWYEYHKLS